LFFIVNKFILLFIVNKSIGLRLFKIRAQFQFRAVIARTARTFLRTAISTLFGTNVSRADVTVVGVHVRVKDMASNYSLQLGYTTAPVEYLDRAMQYFARRFAGRRVLFVLCTDDPAWVLDHSIHPPEGTKMIRHGVKERTRDVEDLATLAACNHMIMTVGTFGWWAAWLAGGITVYYKDFPSPDSFISDNFVAADYFYPRWIGM